MISFNQKTRVFWHEVGHFVASCYNQQHYGWFGTQSITITKQHIGSDRYDFKGEHEPIKPENHDSTEPIKQPAATIASLAYGCIFQAIRHDYQRLIYCFDQNIYANGYDDFKNVAGIAARFKIYPPDTKPIYDCIDAHFEKIRNNPEFKELFAIYISDFIEREEDQLNIDIERVKILVVEF
jgi:hypothetical protein